MTAGAALYARGVAGAVSSITKFDLATFTPSTMVSGSSIIYSITVDAESIYWASPGVVMKTQK